MNRLILGLAAFLAATPAWAIETLSGGNTIYQTTPPTSTQVPNWTTGWGRSGITGWNYVGQIGSAGGVYLGNGWVLTAAHVGVGAFTLNGVTYQPVAGTTHSSFTYTSGANTYTADLTLFQIASPPNLPALTISQNDPNAFLEKAPGSPVVLIGYGSAINPQSESWGYDTVDLNNELVTPTGLNYESNDFITVYDVTYTSGGYSSTNYSNVVGGDSGGGDFIYNSTTKAWELAGINEVAGAGTVNNQSVTLSGYVQLNSYASQINALVDPAASSTDGPTMPLPGLVVMGCLLFLGAARSLGMKPAGANPS